MWILYFQMFTTQLLSLQSARVQLIRDSIRPHQQRRIHSILITMLNLRLKFLLKLLMPRVSLVVRIQRLKIQMTQLLNGSYRSLINQPISGKMLPMQVVRNILLRHLVTV